MKLEKLDYRREALAFAAGLLLAAVMFSSPLDAPERFSGTANASANIVAVSSAGEGTISEVNVRIVPGDGEVLLETNPFIGADTQLSAETAKEVAERITGTTLKDKNVVYDFDIEGSYLGGTSAGAAMTLATVAALEEEEIPREVEVTGTVRPDGRIGRVGDVLEKTYTAGENSIEDFYVPRGQGNLTMYRRVVEKDVFYPGLLATKDVKYRPFTVSLDNISQEKYGMQVHEAWSIEELYTSISKK
jgi:predicted S18 family serine protease